MGAIDGTENNLKKIGVLFVLFYHDEKRVTSHLHGGISLAHPQKKGIQSARNTLLANSMGMASTLRLPTYHNG